MEKILTSSSYLISKIFDDYHQDGKLGVAVANVKMLKDMLAGFENALIERNKKTDELIYWKSSLILACDRIIEYFTIWNMDKEDAYIYIHFIDKKFEEMRKVAREIDEEYSA